MGKENNSIFGMLLGLGVLVIIGVILWWLISKEPNIFMGLIIGLVPSAITFWRYNKEREQNYRNWLLRNKEACAIELVDILMSGMSNSDGTQQKSGQKDMLPRLRRLLPSLVIWGSPELLKQWETLQTESGEGSEEEIFRMGEAFLRTVRKDLGHDDSGLVPGALWATSIIPEEKHKVYDAFKGQNNARS